MNSQHISFDGTIFFGKFNEGFLGAALDEGLVKANDLSGEVFERARRSDYKKRALELFLLFDQIHLRNWYADVKLPPLQDEGRITMAQQDHEQAMDLIRMKVDHGSPENIPQSTYSQFLEDIYYLKPLIIEEIQSPYSEWQRLANKLNISTHVLYSVLFELIPLEYSEYIKNYKDPEDFPYFKHSPHGLEWYHKNLLPVVKKDPKLDWAVGFFMNWSMMIGDSILNVLNESSKTGYPVSWGTTPKEKCWPENKSIKSTTELSKTFNIIRCSFKQEGLIFPNVESFSDVSRLRKKKYLHEFRETLATFYNTLSTGEHDEIIEVCKEVKKANKALKSVGLCRSVGEISGFLSLPALVLDSTVTGRVAGLVLTTISTSSTAYSKIVEKRNRWILFGQS